MHENYNAKENTVFQRAWCHTCAEAVNNGWLGTEKDCPQRGTFHGQRQPFWISNTLGKLADKLLGFVPRVPRLTGDYAWELRQHNLISNVGHAALNAKATGQGSYGTFNVIAIGQGLETAAATDKALSYELVGSGGTRKAASASQTTTTVTNDTAQLQATFTFSGTVAITEEGIFDASTTPVVTTLSAAISTTGATSISVTSGAGITNSDFIQIDNEILQVTAGGGTTTLTVTRGQQGTTAATHVSGAGVTDFTAGGGNMLAKQTFAVDNFTNGNSLTITHSLTT